MEKTKIDTFVKTAEELIQDSRALSEIVQVESIIGDNELLGKIIRARVHGFYGTMYGKPEDKILYIDSTNSSVGINRNGNLYYIWGWPGPDYTIYNYKDYGITWALTTEEFKEVIE